MLCFFSSGGRSYYDETDTQTFYSEVLRYNATEDKWQKTDGDLDVPRSGHKASAVDWDVIAPFCTKTTSTTTGTIPSYTTGNHIITMKHLCG